MVRKLCVVLLVWATVPVSAQRLLTLDSCRQMALRNNKEIQQASMGIEKAAYQRKEAAAAYLPQFDLTAGYIYNSRKVSLIKEDQMLPTKSFNSQTGQYDYNLVIDPTTGYPLQVNGQYVPSTIALLPKSGLTYNIHNLMGGALTLILDRWISNTQQEVMAESGLTIQDPRLPALVEKKINEVIYSLNELVHGFELVLSMKLKS